MDRKIITALRDIPDDGVSAIAIGRLYEAYAQHTLEQAGIHVDLDELCGFTKDVDDMSVWRLARI